MDESIKVKLIKLKILRQKFCDKTHDKRFKYLFKNYIKLVGTLFGKIQRYNFTFILNSVIQSPEIITKEQMTVFNKLYDYFNKSLKEIEREIK